MEAGDLVCEEGGESGGVDGGLEGDAETGGGVEGWAGGGDGGDLGLVDAIEEGGFDGLEADECPLAMGELLEETDLDGGSGGEVVEVLAVELAEGLGVLDGEDGRVVENEAAPLVSVWAGGVALVGPGIELGCAAHHYSPAIHFRSRRGGSCRGWVVSD